MGNAAAKRKNKVQPLNKDIEIQTLKQVKDEFIAKHEEAQRENEELKILNQDLQLERDRWVQERGRLEQEKSKLSRSLHISVERIARIEQSSHKTKDLVKVVRISKWIEKVLKRLALYSDSFISDKEPNLRKL